MRVGACAENAKETKNRYSNSLDKRYLVSYTAS